MGEWISAKDALPPKAGYYLVYATVYFTPDHVDECDHYTAIRISWFSPRFGFVESASHWMYLPEPPKEERKQNDT